MLAPGRMLRDDVYPFGSSSPRSLTSMLIFGSRWQGDVSLDFDELARSSDGPLDLEGESASSHHNSNGPLFRSAPPCPGRVHPIWDADEKPCTFEMVAVRPVEHPATAASR